MSLTFVSSFINYYHTPLEKSTVERRLKEIDKLFKMNIPIVVYTSTDLLATLCEYVAEHYKNNQIIHILSIKEGFIESTFAILMEKNRDLKLPDVRLVPKDTIEYMLYLNSKIGFMNEVSKLNPFHSKYFAWVDFNIGSMWKDFKKVSCFLTHLHRHGLQTVLKLPVTETCSEQEIILEKNELFIPICWKKETLPTASFYNKVCWRFCTNFFIGTKNSIDNLYDLYNEHFEPFLKTFNTMVWDMNFFAYLEQEKGWAPITYKANHDDTIVLNFPVFAMSERLLDFQHKKQRVQIREYTFPPHAEFSPSSSSCVEWRNKENPDDPSRYIMNTRYVNYKYLPSGHCSHTKHICTVNKCAFLDSSMNVIGFTDIKEDYLTMGLPIPDPKETFQGIEDIRLFEMGGSIKFTATTVNFSGCARSRIVVGDYDVDTFSLKNVNVIASPTNAFKEKNWIPVSGGGSRFIYSWCPFQIGEVDASFNLHIKSRPELDNIKFPFKEEIRGSSNLVYDENDMNFVAVVHMSVENTLPKQYYHMLVWLDEATLLPMKFSKLFHFQQYGIEFCLCLQLINDHFTFWVSRQDRDPLCITVQKENFLNTFSFET